MPDATYLLQLFNRWLDDISRCMSSPMSMPVCKPFWETVMYLSAAVGLALLLWATWQLIDYLLKLHAARRAQQERERVADKDTMRQHVWDDDKYITDEVTDPHLAEKIRKELEHRRLRNIPGGSR